MGLGKAGYASGEPQRHTRLTQLTQRVRPYPAWVTPTLHLCSTTETMFIVLTNGAKVGERAMPQQCILCIVHGVWMFGHSRLVAG